MHRQSAAIFHAGGRNIGSTLFWSCHVCCVFAFFGLLSQSLLFSVACNWFELATNEAHEIVEDKQPWKTLCYAIVLLNRAVLSDDLKRLMQRGQ